MKKILLILTALICLSAYARGRKKAVVKEQVKTEVNLNIYRYRLTLKDKANNPYSLQHPEAFLSQKSLERRQRLGIQVDEHDLPITPAYLKQIAQTGCRIFNYSKWNNTVQVEVYDTLELAKLEALPFITSTLLVYKLERDSIESKPVINRAEKVKNDIKDYFKPYGKLQTQAELINIPALHEKGYRGEGMTIAVLDGGFNNADLITAFDSTRILGIRNFTRPGEDMFADHAHGMMVLSCMMPNIPKKIVGTAPCANYYLFETEDTDTEYRGEEDNWCAAVEYADSLGVDVISSSLGYTHFDTPEVNLKYAWLDGEHELNSRSASLAASRGILLCNSAGNEGDGTWKKIGFPADGKDILTVGAVTENRVNTDFSSLGYTADHRVKPDVMSMGGQCYVLDVDGTLRTANGTSFACPILAGAATCLWQAFPDKRPTDIIDALHRASDNYDTPNEVFGYGIPDFQKAYELLIKN